jgi:hypothetical protein
LGTPFELRTKKCLALVPALLLLGAAPRALGTTLVHMDVLALTHTAHVVARARCLGNSTRWQDGHLWTLTRFAVVEAWKSPANSTAPQTVVVRLVGGRDRRGTVSVDGVPRFRVGEEVVLFLEPSATPSGRNELTITSWAQGTFRIRRDPTSREEIAIQDTSVVELFEPATQALRAGSLRRMPLAELRQRVLQAAADAGSASP